MRYVRLLICLLLTVAQIPFLASSAHAASPSGLVISHVIAGESNFTSSELVAIYNNSTTDVDMTGYCIWNGSNAAAIICIQAEANTKVFIRAHGFLTISSSTFASNHVYTPDTTYPSANKIAVGGDSVILKDALGSEVDRVTWGNGKLTTGGTLIRKESIPGSGILADTDATDPMIDFISANSLSFPANASYDEVTFVDVCPNIAGVQQSMPASYLADVNGNCQPDSCLNLDGLQLSVPENYDSDTNGNCSPHDECDNLSAIQETIPMYMIRVNANDCAWDIDPLQLTEILPNAIGSDTGNEFVEVYNPTDHVVDLNLYSVKTGITSDKTYAFPVGATIAPGEYRSFSDSAMKFTLVNTTSRVVLTAVDGTVLGDTGNYDSPADGESWAMFDSVWQYTNQPTSGSANQASITTETATTDTTDTGPAPCPAGKYRNPLTNRCRTIATDVAVMSTCDADQYRNPETGRCRKISTTLITPCKEGQYRSEETNRCRNIVTASTAKACKDAQYRSEETGRCRNLPSSTVPAADFAVQPVKDTGMAFVGWWALGGVGLLAAGYAGWEWRRELAMLWRGSFGRFR